MTFTTYLKSIRSVAYLLPAARILSRIPAATINRMRRLFTRSRLAGYDRLHLGSGRRQLPGWANIDMFGARNIIWDLRSPLPVRSRQIRFVYTEHFIEHIKRSDCLELLRSVRRSMHDGAVLRISTPDLRVAARDYLDGKLVQAPHGQWYPQTPCQMLNEGMRLWGHTYLYDQEELTALLFEAGFGQVRRVRRGASDYPELRDLESRPDCEDLIVEATLSNPSGHEMGSTRLACRNAESINSIRQERRTD